MEPSPKAPGICWERSLCLPCLGRRERGGCRGSPDPFQASSSPPPRALRWEHHGQETPGCCRAPGARCGRRGSAPGNTSVQRGVCAQHLHGWGLSKHCRARVSKSRGQKDLARVCSSLRGTLNVGRPRRWGSSAHRPPRCDGRWTPVPAARCHVEPGRVCSGSCPVHTDTRTHTRTHTHRPVPSRSWSPWPPPGSAWHGGTAGIK